jgi:glutamate dehydrogenase (NAD(P)+)
MDRQFRHFFCVLLAGVSALTGCAATSDVKGGIHAGDGLDIVKLMEHVKATGSVVGFPGSKPITNDEVLRADCDVLVPAALGHVIDAKVAADVKAKYLLEGANGPCTLEGNDALDAKGVVCLPDIWANAGGVTVSYFEWVQNVENEQWEEEEVNARLLRKMNKATDSVLDSQRTVNASLAELEARRQPSADGDGPLGPVDLRTAAYILAVKRVADVTLKRGIWP